MQKKARTVVNSPEICSQKLKAQFRVLSAESRAESKTSTAGDQNLGREAQPQTMRTGSSVPVNLVALSRTGKQRTGEYGEAEHRRMARLR